MRIAAQSADNFALGVTVTGSRSVLPATMTDDPATRVTITGQFGRRSLPPRGDDEHGASTRTMRTPIIVKGRARCGPIPAIGGEWIEPDRTRDGSVRLMA